MELKLVRFSAYEGNNCEFENKCRTKDADGATGDIYCLKHNGIECVPVDNDFMCKCKSNYKWNRFTKVQGIFKERKLKTTT